MAFQRRWRPPGEDKADLMSDAHRDLIREQFTRQAIPFAQAAAIRDADILERIVTVSGAARSDNVLDVGCGPGLLACSFAPRVRHVTGADVTWAMLQQARAEQRARRLVNTSWVQADGAHLPWRDREFSIVTSRFTFHHLQQPLAVLQEMARVCRRGGRVVVVDASPAMAKAAAFNRMEKLRDPSHVRALPIEEMTGLFTLARLQDLRIDTWRMPGDLESFLARSFPKPGDDERVRQMFRESLADDSLDVATRLQDDAIVYEFPVALVSALVT
jgi:ubiquinone/menaquinone biosynthesis C-methylase UbiE